MEVCHLTNILKVTILTSILLNSAKSQEPGTTKSTSGTSYFFYQRTEYPRDCADVMDQCSTRNSTGVFIIKPDGHDEPFEVLCQNDVNGGGWTLIQQRMDGFINFNRSWSEFKDGFGFINSEYWIGNQKLSFLTNQKKYQLRIDMENADGSSFYVTYDSFRITDEFSDFSLVNVGQYGGTAASYIEPCPTNTVFKTCTCQTSCDNPDTCLDTCDSVTNNPCICPEGFFVKGDECVPQEGCGCYISGIGIIPDGASHINNDCTEDCTCQAGTLTCDSSFRCGSNAECKVVNDTRGCYCHDGFHGDGQTCISATFTDCHDVYNSGVTNSGVYNIKPTGWPGSAFEVFCNMSNGGGWTVFQRRQDGSVDFYRDWDDYKNGFPDTVDGELWLGNEKLYHLTNQGNYEMRIDFMNQDGVVYNMNYDAFQIGNENDDYELTTLGSFTGNTGYDYMAYHRGRSFTTHDDDNDGLLFAYGNYCYDGLNTSNCAACYRGAWWYNGCYRANLNGDYSRSDYSGVAVYNGDTSTFMYSLRFTEMKVRPV